MKNSSFPPRLPVSAPYRALFEAIRRGRKIAFVYEGTKQKSAFPHVLGHRDGEERVLVYQTEGDSDGPLPQWRCLAVERISGLRQIDGAWRSGPSHTQRHSCVETVDIDINRDALQRHRWPQLTGKKTGVATKKSSRRKTRP